MLSKKESWVTLEEAEILINANFLSDDPLLETWEGLSDSNKEVLLRQSARAITDAYKFIGRKANPGQYLAFPRYLDVLPVGIAYSLYTSQFFDNGISGSYDIGEGLEEAQLAQVINAVYGATLAPYALSTQSNFMSGLKSKSVGPINESYGNLTSITEAGLQGIYTKKVEGILSKWLTSSHFSF